MTIWTYIVRELRKCPGRTALTLLGISLAVATVVATRITIGSAHGAYQELFARVAGEASLEVVASGGAGFDPHVAAALTSQPAVQAVIPCIQATATLTGSGTPRPILVVGLDPATVHPTDYTIAAGRLAADDGEVVLEAGLAEVQGLTPGSHVQLWTPSGAADLLLVGTVRPSGSATPLALMALATAQRLFALSGQVNTIRLMLHEGRDPEQVQSELAHVLPPGLLVQEPGTRGRPATTTLLTAEQGLGCLSILAVVAAAFVLLNTFLLNLGERRRQLATLRALGATQAQVRRLLLGEAALLGLVGTIAGLGGGLALALLLRGALAHYLGVALAPLQLTAEPFLLALLLGPGIAVIAACIPAWRAGRRQPLEELRNQQGNPCDGLPAWLRYSGPALLLPAALLGAGLCLGWFSVALSRALLAPSVALLLAGSLLLVGPRFVPLLERLSRWRRHGLSVESHLALRQLVQHPTRTGLTGGVLFLALVVAVGFGQVLRDSVRDLQHWYGQTIRADFLVRGSMPDNSFLLAAALPESVGSEIAACPEVGAVEKLSFLPEVVNDQHVLVLARTFERGRPLPLDLREGEAGPVLDGLLAGEAVLGTMLAQRLGLHRGDEVQLATAHGLQRLHVAGTVNEYALGGQALYLEWSTAKRLLEVPGVHVFLVSSRPGATETAALQLRGLCERRTLVFQSNDEMHEVIDSLFSRVVALLWGLMALAFFVAALGVVNTLTMNVLEQRRALAVLRALGMKRRQICRVILSQAWFLALTALLPGAAGGVGLAWFISQASAWALGRQVLFQLDLVLLSGCCGLSVVMALLAAVIPALSAARGQELRIAQPQGA